MKLSFLNYLFIILLLLLPLGLAVKPAVQQTTTGLTIAYPNAQAFKIGDDFDLYFHVFNSTNGAPLDKNTINCTIHIYNHSNNKHIVEENLTYRGNYDFEYEVNHTDFTEAGFYPYITFCYNIIKSVGGYVSDEILITYEGTGDLGFIGSTAWVFVLLPLLFGFLLMKWVNTLGEEHNIFKLFLSLLSVSTLFASLWIGAEVVIKLEFWNTLTEGLSTITYLYGTIFMVMVFYFVLYIFKSIIDNIRKNKQEKFEY